jgi:hypothetical protein
MSSNITRGLCLHKTPKPVASCNTSKMVIYETGARYEEWVCWPMNRTMKNSRDGSEKRWRVVGLWHAIDYPANLAANSTTRAEQSEADALQKKSPVVERGFC